MADSRTDDRATQGIGSFLRGLLAGIPWSECAECVDEQAFAAPAERRVRIENRNGRTRVLGEDRDDVLVRTAKRARAESTDAAQEVLGEIRIVGRESGGTLSLEVETPRKWNRHAHAHVEVRVPRGTQVDVQANNGKVCVEGLRANVSARSTNGAVRVTDIVGDIDIETSNAKVCCSCTCGRLAARSSNGKIELDEHRGSVDASTSNGMIRASVDEMGNDGVVLATSNGRIVLELPEEVDAEVDIRVDNGVIRTLRDLSSRNAESAGRVRGRLGRGGTQIKLRTSNGTVSLR